MKRCSECHGEFQDTVQKCPIDYIELDSEQSNPLIGVCLAERYKIISLVGSGGTGAVYKAQHLKMDKPVAVKIMHAHMVVRPDALRSFYDEAKTIAQLNHHNIVTLYDFGISATNQPFLVMDYLDGPSLRKYTLTRGPLPLEEMSPILTQIIDGLAYAHSKGIVHQDLKPENIILSNSGNEADKVTLVDFGLAILSSTDKDLAMSGNKKKKFIGSPYYMSPEQCLSNTVVDSRSDIYSLSIVIYEALCNKLPFEKKSAMAMLDSHVREVPIPFKNSNAELSCLEACTELTKVFNKAMAKQPEDRYENISAFGAELDDALARDSIKLRALKHRSLAAEEVLVHVNRTNQIYQNLNEDQGQIPVLQLDSATHFLSQQADIEEAYLDTAHTPNLKVIKGSQAENIVVSFLNRLKSVCGSKNNKPISTSAGSQGNACLIEIPAKSICPNCRYPLKSGVQFCLKCQRRISPTVHINRMAETLTGKSLGYRSISESTLNQQQGTKIKLKNLRQHKLFALAKAQKILNYALILSLVIGGIVIAERYLNASTLIQNLSVNLLNNKPLNNTDTTSPNN